MNPGQEKFFNFILERVHDEKKNEATALLQESFAKQEAGTFNGDYLSSFASKMTAILKPEYMEEVTAIMKQFGGSKQP